MNADRRDDDAGFTLVEILISIVLIGMLMPVLAGAFIVVLRTTPSIEDRTDNARTLQGIVTWLPQDIDSTPPQGYNIDAAAASGCSTSPGTNLLRLEWTENVGAGDVRYVANYRHVLVGISHYIQRITCYGVGSGPLPNTVARTATSALPPLPSGWTPGQLPVRVVITADSTGDVMLVGFEVQTLTGTIVRIDSAPKNPANTLVPPSTEAIPVAPTTTSAIVPPCVVLSTALSPGDVKNTDPNGNGKSATNVGVLAAAVTLSVTTSGVCTGLDARAQTGAPNGELFRNFTGDGSTFSVTFPGYPQGSSELWADGNPTISVYSAAGGPYASVTLEVK